MTTSGPGNHGHGPADPSCLDVFERLSEYLDGELSAGDRAHIEAHVRDCTPCVAFVESLKQSIRISRGFTTGAAPGQLTDDLCEKLKAAWHEALKRSGR